MSKSLLVHNAAHKFHSIYEGKKRLFGEHDYHNGHSGSKFYQNRGGVSYGLRRDTSSDVNSDEDMNSNSDDEDKDYFRYIDPLSTERGRDLVVKNDTELFCLSKALEENDRYFPVIQVSQRNNQVFLVKSTMSLQCVRTFSLHPCRR